MAGYHLNDIPRGVYGKISKIREELFELQDAMDQGNRIMVLCELSDLVGAILAYAERIATLDVETMAKIAIEEYPTHTPIPDMHKLSKYVQDLELQPLQGSVFLIVTFLRDIGRFTFEKYQFTLDDLLNMAKATKKAFEDGTRHANTAD